MKFKFIGSIFLVGLLFMVNGCQSVEPMQEAESRQAEQSTKVSINVVGEEEAITEMAESR